MAFSGQQDNRTLICSNGTKLENLSILQSESRFLTLLECKDRKSIIYLSQLRCFSNGHRSYARSEALHTAIQNSVNVDEIQLMKVDE